jgi:tetratricopeptide (TPR) repeat protein
MKVTKKVWCLSFLILILLCGCKSSPDYTEIDIAVEENNQEKAFQLFDELVVKYPKKASVYHNRAITYARFNEMDLAYENINKAIDLDGEKDPHAISFFIKGRICLSLNKVMESVYAFQKSLLLDPSFADAYDGYAICLALLGNINEAIKQWETCISLDNEYYPAFRGLALAYDQTQKYAKSYQFWNKYLEYEKNDAEAYWQRGRLLYWYLNDAEQGLIDWNRAVELDLSYADMTYDKRGIE